MNDILELIEETAKTIEECHGVSLVFSKNTALTFVEEIRSMMKTLDFYETEEALDCIDMKFLGHLETNS